MVTLGDGPNSIFHDGGTAIVIHAKEDDYKTDPGWELGPAHRPRRYSETARSVNRPDSSLPRAKRRGLVLR
jgi:hypothetical protein